MPIKLGKLKKPKGSKGAPPVTVSSNLAKASSAGTVPIQLKISPELRREYRAFAAEHDLELNELFSEIWDHYKKTHG